MNFKGIARMLSNIMLIEIATFVPPMLISIIYKDYHVLRAFMITSVILLVFSLTLRLVTDKNKRGFYAREGFMLVSGAWIIMSLFGALPFFISGEIPNYIDAFFETVSGFTTTGSSILVNVEVLSPGLIFWSSFAHWLGGMGILVFMLAVMPFAKEGQGQGLYVLRAETPGPTVEKFVPKIRQHSIILYSIYISLTIVCFLFLFLGDMSLFDSMCIAFGTAGTGGFGIRADSMASFSAYSQTVVSVSMALFGINYNIYFLILLGKFKAALKNEEMRVYLVVVFLAITLISFNIHSQFDSIKETIHHSAFTVSSLITSTGYTTADYNQWPEFSKNLLILLMISGACAGSTSGGIKISRMILMIRNVFRGTKKLLRPRSVMPVRFNGTAVDEKLLQNVNIFFAAYAIILTLSVLIISIDGYSFETNFTAVVSSLSNIGPGIGAVGPRGNFSGFSYLSKIVLAFDMLLGRLEIFPLIIMLQPRIWRKTA